MNASSMQKFRDHLFTLKADVTHYMLISILVGVILPVLFYLVFLSGKKKVMQRGVPVEVGDEKGITMRNKKFASLIKVPWEGATTMTALFEDCCKKYVHDRFLGTRELISREVSTGNGGRTFEKLHLGEYKWLTYGQVFDRACNFGSGLVNLGHDLDHPVAIFSETRAEWFIALQGCLRQNVTVVTVYSTLGEEALVHTLNETGVSTLICDSNKVNKLSAINSRLENIKHIIYFEDEGLEDDHLSIEGANHWRVLSFNDVVKSGIEHSVSPILPSSGDIAVIMYTSGSTGLPKGVMITHENIVATAAAVMTIVPKIGNGDIYLAYLPLSHIFEFEAEIVMMIAGSSIGYGSPLTLTDTSNKIKKGTCGDAPALHPTTMTAVPMVLDRVRDVVLKKVNEKGGLSKKLFNIAYKRRHLAVEGSWLGSWGLEQFLWDAIVFRRMRSVLGGKMCFMLCGGAPLSKDTQRFMNICFGIIIGQGYGLTETCASATFTDWDDPSVGHVGPPLPCCYIKLVSWEEGGYTVSDKPFPRGEIIIGGYSVAKGYYKNEAETNKVYQVDERGMRWFCTGDIGQFLPDGCLEIIDRKKDIVKLQHGEYVSLGKVESVLVASKCVDNIMVYADPYHSYCVAVVIPDRTEIETWAKARGIQYEEFGDLCQKEETIKEIQQSLTEEAKRAKLNKFETPARIILSPDPWTPESGLVTAALKLKREQLKKKFKDELVRIYE